jgi:SRSO17 transposase
MLAKVGELVLPAIERSGPVEAWIIDDTGFPKKGRHSVGVTRQYCGQLGKQDNCQVAVTLSLANHDASLPIAYQLYLPEDWAKDQARRHTAKVPETIAFQTKPEIALGQIKAARRAGLPQGVVLMDAGSAGGGAWRDEYLRRAVRNCRRAQEKPHTSSNPVSSSGESIANLTSLSGPPKFLCRHQFGPAGTVPEMTNGS